MTDIVTRLIYGTQLRNYDALVELCKEAADEIERLREENKFLRSLVADELRALEPKP